MNKRGQVLVTFILILPLIIIFLGLVIDIGLSLNEKRRTVNVLDNAIKYSLNTENITEEKIEDLIKDNIDEYKTLTIELNSEDVKITIIKETKSVFGNIFDIGMNTFEITLSGNFNTKEITRK